MVTFYRDHCACKCLSRGHQSRTTNKSTAPSLKPKNPLQETQPRPQQRTNPNIPQAPTPTPVEPAPSKKITIRIYLDVPHLASPYKTVILTNQLTADMVVDQLLALLEAGGSGFVDNGTWTLFEVCADFGVERPLRDWEVVTDVVEAWLDGNGGLLPGGKGGWPKVEGRFDVEIKPGKWKRRYFILREDVIYYKERESDRAPTRYCFALRSTASLTVFEKADEYAHYFCVENQTQMVDWVLGIRLAKVRILHFQH
ncbi:hypothetical protein BC830DRAFT_1059675 [Chytriomyces sp. MP71]|nr:hypothetical protein BC830DRAFT_1059675 [Chytriomyces sp. MP71]